MIIWTPILRRDVIQSLLSSHGLWLGGLSRVGGLVMRTGIFSAASPRRLRWQAAFTIEPYQSLTPFVWHHTFVSDARMTNWRGGSDQILCWALDGSRDGQSQAGSLDGVRKRFSP